MRTVRSSGHLMGTGGVCPGVCIILACIGADAPRTEFLIHACENITFPQLLLRTVIKCLVKYAEPFQNI